jgi:FdhE protein
MSNPTTLQPDPSQIGGVVQAPFVRLPDPAGLFARRAQRFGELASTGDLAPYLNFLGALGAAQNAILPDLPEPEMPDAAAIERARGFAMPPLDRGMFKPDLALRTSCDRLFELAGSIPMPPLAKLALDRVRRAEPAALDAMIAIILTGAIPADTVAEHIYVAAVLQIHFARMAARLDAKRLVPISIGICPVCGGPPVASLVVGWIGAEGARYASCAFCATLWNEVRIKCLGCGSTKGIGFQDVEGSSGAIKAETCDECESYVKILYQNKDVLLDPVADDVASLGLDVLLRNGVFRRGAFNPYLHGY